MKIRAIFSRGRTCNWAGCQRAFEKLPPLVSELPGTAKRRCSVSFTLPRTLSPAASARDGIGRKALRTVERQLQPVYDDQNRSKRPWQARHKRLCGSDLMCLCVCVCVCVSTKHTLAFHTSIQQRSAWLSWPRIFSSETVSVVQQ